MFTRRDMLRRSAQIGAGLALSTRRIWADDTKTGLEVNDVQSQLNSTRVRRIVTPRTIDDVQATLRAAAKEQFAISVCGGRHAMGGQQFGRDTLLIDTKQFN